MPYDLSKPLVIGISSRALFNLEQENKIFEEQGVEAYEAYQVAHENEILQKGAAFQLIKAFLKLNNTGLGRLGGSDHYVTEQCKHMSSYL